jgi:hypothetical protein
MAGTMPPWKRDRLAEIASPHGSGNDLGGLQDRVEVQQRLAMPMNTTPRTGNGDSRRICATCATISQTSRFREKPRRPVAQKAQPKAQPA